jgi:hypothetical protein
MLGSDLSDPPHLTKREAARAAQALWRQMTEWYGEEFDTIHPRAKGKGN